MRDARKSVNSTSQPRRSLLIATAFLSPDGLRDWASMLNCYGLCDREFRRDGLGEEGCRQTAGSSERQPRAGNRTVARDVNQICTQRRREAAKNCCGHAVGKREA